MYEEKAELYWLTERHIRLVDFLRQAVSKKTAGGGAPFAVEAPPKLRPTEEIPADSHGNEPGLGSDPAKESLNDIDFGERYAQQAFRNAAEAGQPIAELKAMFAQHQRMEIALLDEALNHATTRAERARAIYRELGIDDRSVVAASDYALAAGGPLISVSYGSTGKDEISAFVRVLGDM